MKRIAILLFAFLVPTLAFAQAPPKSTATIIVTADAVPETEESTPATVTVIRKKDIDDRAARDVADVLREVPGVAVARTGSFGKSTSLFLRGASSKQTLVLWNGIEINDPYFSGYNFGQFSTAGVQRVEVARGPFSSLYGADAVGGVVNIITTGGANHTVVDLAGGGHGLRNGVVSVKEGDFFATVEHRQDDGFAPNDNDRQNSFSGGYLHQTTGYLLGLLGRYSNSDLGVPRNTNAFATAYVATPHHRENGKEWQLAVPFSTQLSRFDVEGRLSESRREDNAEDPDAGSFGQTRSQRRGVHLQALTPTSFGTIVFGGSTERDEAKNHDNYGLDLDTHKRNSDALFVEDRFGHTFHTGRLELSAGVRHDHYSTFGSETSPRAAVAWWQRGNKFRAAYGEAFRAPQIGELYLPFFGNPDLHAEHSRSTEIGYDHYFESGAAVSLTAFHNDFRDLIFYDLVQNRFNNIGKSRSRGIELAAHDRRGPWTAGISYTYLKATDESTGEQLVRRPKHSGSLSLGYDFGTTYSELVVLRTGSRPDVTDLFPFGTVTNKAYTRADLTVRWNHGALEPYVKVENLSNTKYEEVFGYPSPTRRAIIGIRYTVGGK